MEGGKLIWIDRNIIEPSYPSRILVWPQLEVVWSHAGHFDLTRTKLRRDDYPFTHWCPITEPSEGDWELAKAIAEVLRQPVAVESAMACVLANLKEVLTPKYQVEKNRVFAQEYGK